VLGNLEDEISPESIVAEIVLLRAAFDCTVLIVEGASDEKFLAKYVSATNCQFIIGHGRERVENARHVAVNRGLSGILYVVDRDYDDLLGRSRPDELIMSDDNDIEVMLVRSKAFDELLIELGSKGKLSRIKSEGREPRRIVRSAARWVGALRFISARDSLNLTFEKLKYSFLDVKNLHVNVGLLITEVVRRSQKNLEQGRLASLVKSVVAEHHPWGLCCGHDLTAIAGKAFQRYFGTNNAGDVTPSAIETYLRMGYEASQFKKTEMYRAMVRWQEGNRPYTVFE
jgi:hypothetical protein